MQIGQTDLTLRKMEELLFHTKGRKKMTDNLKIEKEKLERDKFTQWRKDINKQLPEIAEKVFSFRNKMYRGAGFHWALEKKLGVVIGEINNYDKNFYHDKEGMLNRILLETHTESLLKQVARIERGITRCTRLD